MSGNLISTRRSTGGIWQGLVRAARWPVGGARVMEVGITGGLFSHEDIHWTVDFYLHPNLKETRDVGKLLFLVEWLSGFWSFVSFVCALTQFSSLLCSSIFRYSTWQFLLNKVAALKPQWGISPLIYPVAQVLSASLSLREVLKPYTHASQCRTHMPRNAFRSWFYCVLSKKEVL